MRELLEQTMTTLDALLAAADGELAQPSSHGCAQGKDSRITASPVQRLLAEWLEERARFIGSLVGLTDEQFNAETAPGEWTYRVVAKHVLALERDSLTTIAADRAARVAGAAVRPVD